MKSTTCFNILELPIPAAIPEAMAATPAPAPAGWTFLTNHTHVLVCLAQNEAITLREVAQQVGITERAATGIINALEAAGYLTRVRDGRRNRYTVHRNRRFRHPQEAAHTIDELLRIFR